MTTRIHSISSHRDGLVSRTVGNARRVNLGTTSDRSGEYMRPGVLLASVVLSCMMMVSPASVNAVEYVSGNVEQMQAMAKPFKKQEVNKGRVWMLFVLGASSLFGVTVLVENNGAWFPAIAKANKAMKQSMKAMEEREQQAVLTGQAASLNEEAAYLLDEVEQDESLQNAVLAGIRQASDDAKKTMSMMKEDVPQEIGIDDDDIGSLLDDSLTEETDAVIEQENIQEEEDDDEEEEEEEIQQRVPLFEISGSDIDQSIESRNEATRGQENVDLSGISLEALQMELEKRKNRQT